MQIELSMQQWETVVDLLLQAPYARVTHIVDAIQAQTKSSRARTEAQAAEWGQLQKRNTELGALYAELQRRHSDLQSNVRRLEEEHRRRDQVEAETRKQRAPNGQAPRKRGRPRKVEATPETAETQSVEAA